MSRDLAPMLLGALANCAMVLLAAPLCQGVMRRITARMQSRRGPPILQPYFDLLKLLGKEDVESGEVPALQRFAAYLSLATALVVACLVPMGFPSPLGGAGDAVLLVYVLTLSGLSTLLAGLAAGSTFSLIGISREVMAMIALEPIFAVAVVVGSVHAGSLRLDAVLSGSVYAAPLPLSGVVMLGVMLLAFQAFVGRVPFDASEAETEIMDGPCVDYSGPKLALLTYARAVKLVDHAALFVAMFAPWGSGLPFPASLAVFWAKALALVLLVTFVAATNARYRIDQAVRYYAGFLAASLGAVVLAGFGY